MANSTGKPVKILMLHGFTQSGPLFHAKTRALEKQIEKTLPKHSVQLSYPTAPIELNPADIPDYTSFNGNSPYGNDTPADEKSEAFAWWRRSDTVDPPEYVGIEKGLEAVARVLEDEGPFDGVIGFSQGACLAAMVTSLLEHDRHKAFSYMSDPANNQQEQVAVVPEGSEEDPYKPPQVIEETTGEKTMVTGIPFPTSFVDISHPPFKFAICYGGFIAPGTRYRAFYERPKIQTPLLHVVGTLDLIVDEDRSRELIEACIGNPRSDGRLMYHPGGHYVPTQRIFMEGVMQFIKYHVEEVYGNGHGNKVYHDDRVENMAVPF